MRYGGSETKRRGWDRGGMKREMNVKKNVKFVGF